MPRWRPDGEVDLFSLMLRKYLRSRFHVALALEMVHLASDRFGSVCEEVLPRCWEGLELLDSSIPSSGLYPHGHRVLKSHRAMCHANLGYGGNGTPKQQIRRHCAHMTLRP